MKINFNIEKEDIEFLKSILKEEKNPVVLDTITSKLAFFKTRGEREKKIKIYDPEAEFKPGDLIYKTYTGKLPVSTKKNIDFNRGVILKITSIRERFGLHEIELSYEGTSEFRNYINYLTRQKIGLFLPHKQSTPPKEPRYLSPEDDPRTRQTPMIQKDLNTLKRKMMSALSRSKEILLNSGTVLLKNNLKKIEASTFQKIKDFLSENKRSEKTEFFVENFLNIPPDHAEFPAYCFSLNYIMTNDYKIDFQQTSFHGWGKWQLISVIYYLKQNSLFGIKNPLTKNIRISRQKRNEVLEFEKEILPEKTKYFLTQREISSGALRIRPNTYNLSNLVEIHLWDRKSEKDYQVYYYQDSNLLLGLQELYQDYNTIQGAILTLNQIQGDRFEFSIKVSKKGIIANEVKFDPQEKVFKPSETKTSSSVFVSRATYLEAWVINATARIAGEMEFIKSFQDLIHKVFIEFGQHENNYEMNIFTLHHILDLIYPTKLEHLIYVLLNHEEFLHSEKNPTSFFLDSSSLTDIEQEEKQRQVEKKIEVRKQKEQEQIHKQSEIKELEETRRQKREERRRKREAEMWEKVRRSNEKDQPATEKEPAFVQAEAGSGVTIPPLDLEKAPVPPTAKKSKKKKKYVPDEPKESPKKKAPPKKREPVLEDLDINEIKNDIKLEKLRDKIEDRKAKKKKKEKAKKVAYHDEGSFGSIFGSKLENAIKKKDEK